MRSDWIGTPTANTERDLSVLYYPTASFVEVLRGVRVALPWSPTRRYRVGELVIDAYGRTMRCVISNKGAEPPVPVENLVSNHGAEVNADGWTRFDAANMALTRDVAAAHAGDAGFALECTATPEDGRARPTTTAATVFGTGSTYLARIWVKAPTGNSAIGKDVTLAIGFFSTDETVLESPPAARVTAVLSDTWQQLDVTYAQINPALTKVRPLVGIDGSDTGDILWFDQVELEYVAQPPVFWEVAVEADFELEAPVDISNNIESGYHTSTTLEAQIASVGEFSAPVGSIIVVRDNHAGGQRLFTGVIEKSRSRSLQHGRRTSTLRASSRDASGLWRRVQWTTDTYPVATDVSEMAIDILRAMGLQEDEYQALQPYGRFTPHTNTQFGGIAAWDMLSAVLFPALAEPWTDALGRFRPISRDVRRMHDLDVTATGTASIDESESDQAPSALILKWLDKNLSQSSQQEQVLGTESIHAGFFQMRQRRKVYWSSSRRQRARNTRMVTLTSVNDALLPHVGRESYTAVDEFHGAILVETEAWVPTLATIAIISYLVAANIPDGVEGAFTISIGRIVEAIAGITIWLVMMSLGTGQYEIWGEPFDYVHAINKTEVYLEDTPHWARLEKEISCDLIFDEAHAQEVASAELLYENLAATPCSVPIADDPRVEKGDIVRVNGEYRVYVDDYRRDITRGSSNELQLTGFRV